MKPNFSCPGFNTPIKYFQNSPTNGAKIWGRRWKKKKKKSMLAHLEKVWAYLELADLKGFKWKIKSK